VRWVLAVAAAAALLAGGCAEPTFERAGADGGPALGPSDADAPAPAPAAPDAAEPTGDASSVVAALPSWAEPLRGRYALRARFYGREQSSGTQTLQEVLALALVAQDRAGPLVLELRLCDNTGIAKAALGPELTTRIQYPELYPMRRFPIELRDGVWSTNKVPTSIGYEAEAPGCGAGDATGLRQRAWLKDRLCQCPSDTDMLPTSLDDCRLSDPDADSQPGITVKLTGLFSGTDNVRLKDFSQLVHGRVAPDGRHRAEYAIREDYYALTCTACTGGAQPNITDCHPGNNPVELVPIDASFGCSEIVRGAADSLFSNESRVFPTDC
jgi:hypothetical protein